MKPFNLEAAKAGKPVCIKDGRKTRIICFDSTLENYPLVVLVENYPYVYTDKGRFNKDSESDFDLMMLTEKKEGWINIYKGDDKRVAIVSNAYTSKETALNKIDDVLDATYITTKKIEWEE